MINLYGHKWRKARGAFLAENPLCCKCADRGQVTAATVVDHRIPHRGDIGLFWDRSNWQPLCKQHHDQEKQREDTLGYSLACGDDGWPIDPKHPANRSDARRR